MISIRRWLPLRLLLLRHRFVFRLRNLVLDQLWNQEIWALYVLNRNQKKGHIVVHLHLEESTFRTRQSPPLQITSSWCLFVDSKPLLPFKTELRKFNYCILIAGSDSWPCEDYPYRVQCLSSRYVLMNFKRRLMLSFYKARGDINCWCKVIKLRLIL